MRDNKLIAEFMGLSIKEGVCYYTDADDMFPMGIEVKEPYIPYHTSWDWLMPVVEKILNKSDNDELIERFCANTNHLNHDATYKAVVEFVKMYNTKKDNKMEHLEFYARQESNSIEGIWRNSEKYSIDTNDIETIYDGALDCCACGCEGTYTEPSDLVDFERLLKVFESSTKDYDVTHATYYDGDLNNIFEVATNGRFGIRLYVKKKGE